MNDKILSWTSMWVKIINQPLIKNSMRWDELDDKPPKHTLGYV